MGTPPASFNGTRSQAERFINDLVIYIDLNQNVLNFTSYHARVLFALTCLAGNEVKTWKSQRAQWVHQQPDHPNTWATFLNDFNARFLDSQRDQRARTALESLYMKRGDIDQYITDFEDLAREARYSVDDLAVQQRFLKGLNERTVERIMAPPIPATWENLKAKAVEAVSTQNALYNMFAWRDRGGGGGRGGNRGAGQRCPQHLAVDSHLPLGQTPQYNSTTAPRSYND